MASNLRYGDHFHADFISLMEQQVKILQEISNRISEVGGILNKRSENPTPPSSPTLSWANISKQETKWEMCEDFPEYPFTAVVKETLKYDDLVFCEITRNFRTHTACVSKRTPGPYSPSQTDRLNKFLEYHDCPYNVDDILDCVNTSDLEWRI